jgi:hypothetical protein
VLRKPRKPRFTCQYWYFCTSKASKLSTAPHASARRATFKARSASVFVLLY